MPFLKDSHSHPSLYAVLGGAVDLGAAAGRQEALGLIAAAAAPEQGKGRPRNTLAYNWNDSRFNISPEDLDDLGSVFVCGQSLHNHVMSALAKEIYRPRWKRVVDNVEDARWVERNLPLILMLMIEMKGLTAVDVAGFYESLLGVGVWYAEEMLLPDPDYIRLVDSCGLTGRTAFWAAPLTFRELDEESKARVSGIKIWTDGALGARTAALSNEYLGGERGFLIYEDDEVASFVREAAVAGKAISIHALGDLADEQVLTVLERVSGEDGSLPPVRIEHCQFISAGNAIRAKRLGVVLSMQPNFSSDSVVYADRLGPEILKANNPFRTIIDEAGFVPGADLIFGSDGMPHGVPSALESALFPPHEGQRLHLDEFRAGYCIEEGDALRIEIDDDARTVTFERYLQDPPS